MKLDITVLTYKDACDCDACDRKRQTYWANCNILIFTCGGWMLGCEKHDQGCTSKRQCRQESDHSPTIISSRMLIHLHSFSMLFHNYPALVSGVYLGSWSCTGHTHMLSMNCKGTSVWKKGHQCGKRDISVKITTDPLSSYQCYRQPVRSHRFIHIKAWKQDGCPTWSKEIRG